MEPTISLDRSTTGDPSSRSCLPVPLHLQLIVVPDDCHLDRSGTSVEVVQAFVDCLMFLLSKKTCCEDYGFFFWGGGSEGYLNDQA